MYSFQPPPAAENLDPSILEWLADQLRLIEQQFSENAYNGLPKLYAEPPKPREGVFVNADGTVWNPGAGAGIYVYHDSTWKKVHA